MINDEVLKQFKSQLENVEKHFEIFYHTIGDHLKTVESTISCIHTTILEGKIKWSKFMGNLNAYATLETEGIKTNVKAFADVLQLHEESQLQVMVL